MWLCPDLVERAQARSAPTVGKLFVRYPFYLGNGLGSGDTEGVADCLASGACGEHDVCVSWCTSMRPRIETPDH